MRYRTPTVRQYYILKQSDDIDKVLDVVSEIAGDNICSVGDFKKFIAEYLGSIDRIKAENSCYNVPVAPVNDEFEHYFSCFTRDFKIVSEYTRLNFNEILDLEIFDFWLYLRDAVIYNCERTESGREYLENAFNFQSTEPDRESAREQFGGMRHGE